MVGAAQLMTAESSIARCVPGFKGKRRLDAKGLRKRAGTVKGDDGKDTSKDTTLYQRMEALAVAYQSELPDLESWSRMERKGGKAHILAPSNVRLLRYLWMTMEPPPMAVAGSASSLAPIWLS